MQMKKLLVFLFLGVLLLSTQACGDGEALEGEEAAPGSGDSASTSTLTVTNNTQTITICYLYISPTGEADWGEDKLQGTQVAPGEKYTLEVEPGTYDLKASDCDGTNETTREAQDLSTSSEWILTQDVSYTLNIINNTRDYTFCYLYVSPSDSSDWGEDYLQGVQIAPGGTHSVDLSPGIYNVKLEDCDHANPVTREAMDFSTPVSQNWELGQESPSSTDEVILKVRNDTANVTLCYLYVAPSDSSSPWGEDILRGTQIQPGGTFDVTVKPGSYKLKAIDCNQTGQVVNENLNVAGPTNWSVK